MHAQLNITHFKKSIMKNDKNRKLNKSILFKEII